jgi:flagellar hook-basal body complex protein FliE
VTVEPLLPDAAPLAVGSRLSPPADDIAGFTRALDELGTLLGGAENAEDSFASGAGSLQDAVYARARADIALSVATAAAQRGTQAISSILNMQV